MTTPLIRAAQDWQPIETAPRDGSRVLLATDGDVTSGQFISGEWCLADWARDEQGASFWLGDPTHWMPLPDPPPPPKGGIKASEWLPKSNLTY